MPNHPIVRDPTPIREADILLVESTYGNRLHRSMNETLDELEHAINDTLHRKGGNIIVPAFAVGRTQELLFLLVDLHRQGKLGKMDVYVDSPMALAATDITLKHGHLLDKEATEALQWFNSSGNKLKINFVQDVEDSITLNAIQQGALIISASGMCDAGRIKYHLKYNLPRPECTILITGSRLQEHWGEDWQTAPNRTHLWPGDPGPCRYLHHWRTLSTCRSSRFVELARKFHACTRKNVYRSW